MFIFLKGEVHLINPFFPFLLPKKKKKKNMVCLLLLISLLCIEKEMGYLIVYCNACVRCRCVGLHIENSLYFLQKILPIPHFCLN